MEFEKLQEIIIILDKEQSAVLRQTYIKSFINVDTEYFKKHIATTKEYSDGECYSGYLWDCLIKPVAITYEDIKTYKDTLEQVYVLWDIHSREKIFVKDYWKFAKDDVLQMSYSVLLDNLEYFPEDIYIFDDTMSWTLVMTHEYIDGNRYCLKGNR